MKVATFAMTLIFAEMLGVWALVLAMSEANEAALIGSITPTIVAIGAIITGILSYLAARAARQEAKDAKEQVAKNTAVTESVSKLVDGQHTAMVAALKVSSEKVTVLETEKAASVNLETVRASIREALAVTPVIPAAVAESLQSTGQTPPPRASERPAPPA